MVATKLAKLTVWYTVRYTKRDTPFGKSLTSDYNRDMFQSMLQTAWWAKFKESGGWKSERYGDLYGLTRQLPFGRSILYFPEIPLDLEHGIPFSDQAIYISRSDDEKVPSGRIFTRFEFLEQWSPEHANKHDLKIEWGISNNSIQTLFDLYSQTAARADFQGRDLPYFQRLAKTLEENKAGDIIIVSKNNEPLSALLLSFYGGVCSYLYGGSGGDRSLMGPYLAHWEAIKLAKKKGMAVYDLLAIAPEGNENHPHAGLTRFKTQFGGQSVRLLGSWDLVHSRFWYTMYRFVEKRRRKTTS